MLFISCFVLFAVFIAWACKDTAKRAVQGLRIAFLMLFFFLALRYNFGNDYQSYMEIFYASPSEKWVAWIEPGWFWLCKLFSPIGYFGMIICLSGFYCCVFYSLIRKYLPPQLYWLAVLFLTFDVSLLMVNASMLRNSLTMSIFVIALRILLNRENRYRFLWYYGLVFLGTTIHTTMWCMVPVPLILLTVKIRFTQVACGIIILLYLILAVEAFVIGYWVDSFMHAIFPQYDSYSYSTQRLSSGLLSYYNIIPLCLLLYCDRYFDHDIKVYNRIVMLCLFCMVLQISVPSIARLISYFKHFTIIVYPMALWKFKLREKHWILPAMMLLCILLPILMTYYNFFTSSVWVDTVSEYHTIFSAPQWK